MKKIVKGSSAFTMTSVGEMLIRFVRTKCIALFLGPVGTGLLAQLIIFFETLRVLGDFGSRRGVIKQIAQERQQGPDSDRYKEIISTSFLLAIVASCVTSLVVTIFSAAISKNIFGDSSHASYIIFVALFLPIASVATVTASILKGNLEYKSFAQYTLAAYGGVLVLTPLLIYFFHYWGAIVVQGLFFVFPLACYLIFNARKKFLYFSKKISFVALKEQFSYGSLQIYQDSLLQLSRLVIASWIIKELGLSVMGIYQVVITFSTVYLTIPIQAMSGYTFPLIASSESNKDITRAVNDSMRFLMFLLVPVIMVLMIFPEIVIRVFFSSDFISAAPVLKIQLFSTLFILVSFSLSSALEAKGKLKAAFFSATLSPLSAFFFTWLFLDAWQLKGVAIAFSIASFATLLAQYFLNRHYFGMRIVPKNQKLLAATVVWVVFVFVTGIFESGWFFRLVQLLLGVPWFLVSAKDHEKQFVSEKLRHYYKVVFKETKIDTR